MQLDSIVGWAIQAFLVTGVAVIGVKAIGSDTGHHSIPWEDKLRLIKEYGTWAVNRAEAFCPENDVACVEREAKRLIEVYRFRREA
jgi:hypothetical protein